MREKSKMRQLINSTYITLDGVVEGPHLWPSLKGGTSDEGGTIQTDLLNACDIVLMGRRTYDGFAPAWTSRSGDPYSDRINAMRKVVVSTTLTDPEWNNTEVIADLLYRPGTAATFDLVDSKVLSNGIVLLTYAP